jgi:ATP-dependent Lon protease
MTTPIKQDHGGSTVGAKKKVVVPLLPLRDIILFPHMVIPIFVGRDRSVQAIDSAMEKDRKILFCLQKDSKLNDPQEKDIHRRARWAGHPTVEPTDGTVKVLVEGERCEDRWVPNCFLWEVEETKPSESS